MSDLTVEEQGVPATPTDPIWPVWQDVVNNWRAVDCHWLRDRIVQIYPTATGSSGTSRAEVLGSSAIPGMLSYITATDSLEMYKSGGTWESVRYPNVGVTSDSAKAVMTYTGAGSGLALYKAGSGSSDGSVAITNFFAGTGIYQSPLSTSTGVAIDATGLAIKVGTKVVKLATDATQLTINSPISVTGDITTSTALKGASATLTGGLTAASATLSGALQVNSGTVTNLLTVGTLDAGTGGNAEMTVASSLAVFRHKAAPNYSIGFDSSGNCTITPASNILLNGMVISPVTGTIVSRGTTYLNQDPANSAVLYSATNGSMSQPAVAGVVAFSRAPTSSDIYPDGTIWFQI